LHHICGHVQLIHLIYDPFQPRFQMIEGVNDREL